MKPRVPSIGSRIQTASASPPLQPVLLAVDAVLGEPLGDQPAHGGLRRPVRLGHRIEGVFVLVVDSDEIAKPRKNLVRGCFRECFAEEFQLI